MAEDARLFSIRVCILIIKFTLRFSLLPTSRNSDPGSRSKLSSPFPTTVRDLHLCYREKTSALSPLVDLRRIAQTKPAIKAFYNPFVSPSSIFVALYQVSSIPGVPVHQVRDADLASFHWVTELAVVCAVVTSIAPSFTAVRAVSRTDCPKLNHCGSFSLRGVVGRTILF